MTSDEETSDDLNSSLEMSPARNEAPKNGEAEAEADRRRRKRPKSGPEGDDGVGQNGVGEVLKKRSK